MVFTVIVSLEKTFVFFQDQGRHVPNSGNARVDPLIEQAKVEIRRDVLEPMEAHHRAVPLGFHQLDGFIPVEFIIDGLHPDQGAAGTFTSQHENPLHITELLPGRGFIADLKGYLFVFRDSFAIIKHPGDHVAGHPVVDFHQEFLRIGQSFDFRSQAVEEFGQLLWQVLLEVFDDGTSIDAAMMLIHYRAKLKVPIPAGPQNLD